MRYAHFISSYLIKHINNQAVLLSFIQIKNEPKMKPSLILCFLIVGIMASWGKNVAINGLLLPGVIRITD
jgi:hypothetical protein